MHNPLVSIIIVNWNGRAYLKDCLGSLSKISYKNIEILFVDNASSDDSVTYVKQNYPKIKIIVNSKNLGFAEGQEGAFKKCKGPAVLLLSMDTIVEKDFLTELVKILYSSRDIGAVQPKLLMYPRTHVIDSIGSFFLMSGMLYHFGREKDPKNPIYNKTMEIFSAKGACILFRKEVIQKTGLFDKEYFAYFEETDLCHRIWLAGYRILYTPSSTVYHKGGGSSKQINYSYILFHSYKNRLCTYLKNLSFFYMVQVIPKTLFLYFCVSIFYLCTGKASLVGSVTKAVFWNLLHLSGTLAKRKYIQTNIRKVDDKTFLPKLTKQVRLSYYWYLATGLSQYRD